MGAVQIVGVLLRCVNCHVTLGADNTPCFFIRNHSDGLYPPRLSLP